MKKIFAILALLFLTISCSSYQSADDFNFQKFNGKKVSLIISDYNTVTIFFEDGSFLKLHSQKYSIMVTDKED